MAARDPLEHIVDRLAEYLGPHTARVAVKTFSVQAQTPAALLEALRPMLRTLLGRDRAAAVVRELEKELP